jgi:predicted ArsR family transcriptional regulator
MERWTFLTNYGHVFLCLAAEPAMRMRDLAAKVGITERSAQRIVADLIADGYLSCERVGRRNQYRVHGELPLRHPNEEQYVSGALLALLSRKGRPQSASDRRRKGARKERVARASSSTRSRRQIE